MPIIQNFALHPFDFPLKSTKEHPLERLTFPAGVAAAGGTVRPSETFVEAVDLETLQAHSGVTTWFGPEALVVKAEPVEASAEESKSSETEGGAK